MDAKTLIQIKSNPKIETAQPRPKVDNINEFVKRGEFIKMVAENRKPKN